MSGQSLKGLARQALWYHLLQHWLACCKPGQILQACCKQAKAAIDGATIGVWLVPKMGMLGMTGDDNKIPNTATIRAAENYDHVTLAGRESLGDFSTEKTEFC